MCKDEKMVEVYRAASEMEGQVIKGLLESYDIPCLLQPDFALPRPYSPVMNIGEVGVLVWDTTADRARELIRGEDDV